MTLLNDLACDRIDFNDDLTTGERFILSEVLGEFFDYNETIIQNEVIDVYRSLAPLIVDFEPEDLNTGSWYTNISSVILESLNTADLEPSEEIFNFEGETYFTEAAMEAFWNFLGGGNEEKVLNGITINYSPKTTGNSAFIKILNGTGSVYIPSFEYYFEEKLWPKIQQGLEDDLFDFNSQGSNCNGTKRKGNVNFQGTAEHWVIQWDYLAKNPSGDREYKVPGSSATGRTGYCDLVNTATGEMFEIKPDNLTGISNGASEIQVYVDMAKLNCGLPGGSGVHQWHKGTNYTYRTLPHPDPRKELEVTLAQNGVIVYNAVDRTTPQFAPVPVPQSVYEKLKDLIERLQQTPAQFEKEFALLIAKHPELKTALKAGGYAIAVGIVAYAIANDVTLVGIVDDIYLTRIAWIIARSAYLL